MWQSAKQAARLVLGTRADTTPELDEDEWTSLLGECKEDANDREVAEDLGCYPIGATVQFHGLCKNGFEYNGLRGTIHRANRKTPGEHEYVVKIVKKPGDTIKKFRVSQTYITLVQDNS